MCRMTLPCTSSSGQFLQAQKPREQPTTKASAETHCPARQTTPKDDSTMARWMMGRTEQAKGSKFNECIFRILCHQPYQLSNEVDINSFRSLVFITALLFSSLRKSQLDFPSKGLDPHSDPHICLCDWGHHVNRGRYSMSPKLLRGNTRKLPV